MNHAASSTRKKRKRLRQQPADDTQTLRKSNGQAKSETNNNSSNSNNSNNNNNKNNKKTKPRQPVQQQEAKLSMNTQEQELEQQPQLQQLQQQQQQQQNYPPRLVVFSGGTAFNGFVASVKAWTTRVTYILPVSDDGGSSAEIVRVFGGPAVGDIRSRCLRLSDTRTAESRAIVNLLGYRLPRDAESACQQWYAIVEGRDPLWENIRPAYKHTIRRFLVAFHHQQMQNNEVRFTFSNGSIGNFFFAGARNFFQSLDAAIFLYGRVSGVPEESVVLPVISTNNSHTLGAELVSGALIRGQSNISHPSASPLDVDKNSNAALESPIQRVLYLSAETNHEVVPVLHSEISPALAQAHLVIYGVGSLYTSLCACLVVRGIGAAMAHHKCGKVLMLNGCPDRETFGMRASDVVQAVTRALNSSLDDILPASAFITHLVVPSTGAIELDLPNLDKLDITRIVSVASTNGNYHEAELVAALQEITRLSAL